MDALEARARLGDSVFVDVREPYEFEAGHIDGSLHIPIGQITERWHEIPRESEVIVVCQIGQRSALVAEFLRRQDVDAHNLDGGLAAWIARALPLVGGESAGHVVDGYARDLTGERLNPD